MLAVLRQQSTGRFDELVLRLGERPPLWSIPLVGRRIARRALLGPWPPARQPTRQGVWVTVPPVDAKARALIHRARFVLVRGDAPSDLILSLIPALLSGRPLAVAGSPRALAAGNTAVQALAEADACAKTEVELARHAGAQLRSLFGCGDDRSDKPRISVVMSTRRRDFIPEAVKQIQAQRGVEVELLVGLHGLERDGFDEREFLGGAVVAVHVLGFAADAVFGDVLQSLSDRATCPTISKWDDDDLYGPHHLVDLWLSQTLTRAPMVGKAAEFVLLKGRHLLLRRQVGAQYVPSRFVAGGALLMSTAALRAVGGWPSVPRHVDLELITRFESAGLPVVRIHGWEFTLVRHGSGHTWNVDHDYFLTSSAEVWSADRLGSLGLISVPSTPVAALPPLPPPPPPPPRPSASSISVCVPNRNDDDSLWLWEQRISEFTGRAPIELIVGDDASDPPLALATPRQGITMVTVDPRPGFGAGRARDRAARAASGEVLVFADADVDVPDATLEAVGDRFRAGFSGAVHARIDFSSIDSAAARSIVSEYGFDGLRARCAETRIAGQDWRESHWAPSADLHHPRADSYRATVGAFLALDRALYERIGGFRDVPVIGVEDVEFGYRLLIAGCEQRVLRHAGITHLGERTFASKLTAEESVLRQMWLNALIPIWAESLPERATTLGDWAAPVVPFVELVPADAWDPGLVTELNETFGPGTAVEAEARDEVLDAPFCIGVGVAQRTAAQATALAYRTLRHGGAGEVVVTDRGMTVGHFCARWALNLAAERARTPLPPGYLGLLGDIGSKLCDSVRSVSQLRVVDLGAAEAAK